MRQKIFARVHLFLLFALAVETYGSSLVVKGVVISSNPSGAKIFVNGEDTTYVTPSRIVLPADHPFTLQLEKDGYRNFTKENLVPSAMRSMYTPVLVKVDDTESRLSTVENHTQSIHHYNAAAILANKGKFKEALLAYSLAIGADPTNIRAWVNRSNIKLHLDDLSGALSDAKMAIDLDPQDALAYQARALVLISKKQYLPAIADLDRGVALRGEHLAKLLQTRGHAHAKAGQLVQAIDDTKRALVLAPEEIELYCNLAIFYARQNNPEAFRLIEKAHKKSPQAPCVKTLWDSTR
jgi:tetratricopeptide (TPR) repeat protein